jgi:hypothetical protein
MRTYRFIHLTPGMPLGRGLSFVCRDDQQALARARRMGTEYRPAGVWEGERFVGPIQDDLSAPSPK